MRARPLPALASRLVLLCAFLSARGTFVLAEPRCADDAQAYARATHALRRTATCASVFETIDSLRPLAESTCAETRRRSRRLRAELLGVGGRWEDALETLARDDSGSSDGLVGKIKEMVASSFAIERARERRDWRRAYALADASAKASACGGDPRTYQRRADAAMVAITAPPVGISSKTWNYGARVTVVAARYVWDFGDVTKGAVLHKRVRVQNVS